MKAPSPSVGGSSTRRARDGGRAAGAAAHEGSTSCGGAGAGGLSVAMETGLGLPEEGTRRSGLDLRLVGPAIGVWAGSAAAGAWPPPTPVLLLAAAVLVGCPAWALVRVRSSAGATPAAVLVSLAFLAAGVVGGGVSARARTVEPLAGLVQGGTTVDARMMITDDPRRSASASDGSASDGSESAEGDGRPPRGATMIIRGRLEGIRAGQRELRMSVPVLVVGRDEGWLGLLPGTSVDVRARLAAPGVGDPVAAILLARAPPSVRGRPPAAQRAAGHLRSGLREAAGVLPQPARGLLPALVVGDTSNLQETLREDFRAAGMSHLTAVSGSNLAIVAGAVLFALGRVGLGLRGRAILAVAAVVAFVILARPTASVVRAAAMAMIGLAALALGRPRAVMPALATTVIVLVLADPMLALSAGFALSVLATAGMVVWGPGWRDALARPARFGRLAEMTSVAAAAQLACTPALAWLGGGVSLVAIPANVLAAPAVPVATVLGVLALAVAAVDGTAAMVPAWLAGLGCRWLAGVAGLASGVPGATVGWPAGPPGALLALVAVVAVVAGLRRRWFGLLILAVAAGLLVARMLLLPRIDGWPPPGWRLVVCDVGQGDALVLPAGPDAAVLVDVGPDPRLLVDCLTELGVRRVPLILLSHLHADHVDGLPGVLGRLPVGEIVVGPLAEPAEQWADVARLAASARVPVRSVMAGAEGMADADGGPDRRDAVRWRVLAPTRVPHGTNSDPNNASLVTHVEVGGVSMLLTGDAEPPEQWQLAAVGVPRVDVLKVPHHGAADQVPSVLAATGASVALISVGTDNTYGHPAPETLAMLRTTGMAVARTDTHGALAVVATSDRGVQVVARCPGGGPGRPRPSMTC